MSERAMSGAGVAIIGAGMAGLACARALADAGRNVTLFDKGRGPGGRMAVRRAGVNGDTVRFDHGTRYFSASEPRFAKQVAKWASEGLAAPWPAAGDGQFVGTPGMNAPLKAMADTLDVHWGKRVLNMRFAGRRWNLEFDDGERSYPNVVVAIPPEQVAQLLAGPAPAWAAMAASVRSNPCWTVMATFAQRLPIDADVISDPAAPISEACRDSAKPGRGGGENWVLQASPQQSQAILELTPEVAADELLALFFAQTGIEAAVPIHLVAHRWLYAAAIRPFGDQRALYDAATGLALAGDWLAAANVEGAWLSGMAAAELFGPG